MSLGLLAELSQSTFRPWEANHRFAGIFHANQMGVVCALLVMSGGYLARRAEKRSWLLWGAVALGFICLYLTRSRTSLLSAVFAAAVTVMLFAPKRKAMLAILAGTCVAAIAILVVGNSLGDAATNAASLGREESEVGSLSNRLPLWEELLPYIASQPLTGYGYTFWSNDMDFSEAAQSAHSTYIDMTLRFGVIGAGLFFTGIFVALARAVWIGARAPASECAFIVMLLMFMLVAGIFETSLGCTELQTLFFMCGIFFLAFREDLVPTTPRHAEWPQVGVEMRSLIQTGIARGYRES
jgi:O-antigen ligase